MKKYMKPLLVFTVLFGAVSIFAACKKKKDTIAKITVRDSANALVAGATVILYGEGDGSKPVTRRDTSVTNSSGIAVFDYSDEFQLGQAGFAVLNIDATKSDLNGEGTIKINEEEENVETVFIQP